MAGKRAATTTAPEPASAASTKSTRTRSKRQRADNDEEAETGETARQAIIIKEEGTDSKVPLLTYENVVVLDDQYDTTLVVGTLDSAKGMKAFRVSRACLRTGGETFKSKIGGDNTRSEFHFPDDTPDAFLIVLHIMYWQQDMLPESMDREDLLELATLCHKYSLHRLIKTIMRLKDWLGPHKVGARLPVNADIQDWVLIALFFRFDDDYEYLVNSLAMNLQAPRNKKSSSLYFNHKGTKITLRTDLPPAVYKKIQDTRLEMVQRIEDTCHSAFEAALNRKICKGAKKTRCASTCVGFLVRLHQGMEMSIYRSQPNEVGSALPHSVRFYWDQISQMSTREGFADPIPYSTPTVYCAYSVCMDGLDPEATVDCILKKYDHNDLVGDWASTQTLESKNACATGAATT